jgi:hypothetical protein
MDDVPDPSFAYRVHSDQAPAFRNHGTPKGSGLLHETSCTVIALEVDQSSGIMGFAIPAACWRQPV